MLETQFSSSPRSNDVQATLQHFVSLAANGLVPMFDEQQQLFCYSLNRTDRGMVAEGLSPRYTMMTLMGLHRLEQAGGVSPIEISPVINSLLANLDWVKDIGDLGVLLWMCACVLWWLLNVCLNWKAVSTSTLLFSVIAARSAE
jgi:hypothetical protein